MNKDMEEWRRIRFAVLSEGKTKGEIPLKGPVILPVEKLVEWMDDLRSEGVEDG